MPSMSRPLRFTVSVLFAYTPLACSESSHGVSVGGSVPNSSMDFAPAPVSEMIAPMPCSVPAIPAGVTTGPGDGAYFKKTSPVRRDITEDLPGARLKLVLRLMEAGSCTALNSIEVHVWHADAGGQYSEPEAVDAGAQAGTFLRGTQFTDDAGLVVFETIFPGWTQGRSPLIHVKAHHNGSAPVSGQEVYFDEETARAVYAEEPYATRGEPDTTAQTDPWQSQLGSAESPGALAVTTQDGEQLVAKATLFVQSGAAQ